MNAIRITLAALVTLSLGACPPSARAQDLTQQEPELASDTRSPSKAFALSFLGTAVPIAVGIIGSSTNAREASDAPWGLLTFSGYLVGPSLGHYYAGRPGHAFAGIGVRGIAVVMMGAAFATSWDNPNTGSDALAVTSLLLGAGMTLVDITSAPQSARHYNDEVRKNRLTVNPAAIGPSHAPGLRADWTF